MSQLFLWLFISICIGILGWGMLRPDRIYQYPFYMAAIFLSFMVPQAFALIENPGAAKLEAIDRVMLMCCLCSFMCWMGYQLKPNVGFLNKIDIPIDEHKLFKAGVVMTIFCYLIRGAYASAIRLASIGGGAWSGPVTILAFFYSVINIAFAICLIHAVKYPNFRNILVAIISSYPVLEFAFGGGRRQVIVSLILTIGLAFFYIRRYLPPRLLSLTAIVGSAYLIPLVGQERGVFWAKLFSLQFDQISWSKGLDYTLGGDILELRNAAILMDAAEYTGQYSFGTGYWDYFVFRFVPGQILGNDFKDSLLFNLIDRTKLESFDYSIPGGTTPTGIGDSFLEFSYFGCLFFLFQAFLFKHIWLAAIERKNLANQVFYVGLLANVSLNITHSTASFFADIFFQFIFLGAALFYARAKPEQLEHGELVTSSGITKAK